jgi:hypothetical protein
MQTINQTLHDMANPIQVISSRVNRLLKQDLPEETKAEAEKLHACVEKLIAILNETKVVVRQKLT